MKRWRFELGTHALSDLWRNKYDGMGDFLGDPVRTETVFTLDDKLREIEFEEEEERAMGREPAPELVAVSASRCARAGSARGASGRDAEENVRSGSEGQH